VITVSSHGNGNTANLLTQNEDEWFSQDVANSWIAWTLPHGITFAIESVRIRGRPTSNDRFGVVNFAIEGSADNVTWVTIIDSHRNPPSFQHWTSEAVIPAGSSQAFARIRLRQTGKDRRLPALGDRDWLVLTYVDFGGTIVYRTEVRHAD
jgi:hypothetical protein